MFVQPLSVVACGHRDWGVGDVLEEGFVAQFCLSSLAARRPVSRPTAGACFWDREKRVGEVATVHRCGPVNLRVIECDVMEAAVESSRRSQLATRHSLR